MPLDGISKINSTFVITAAAMNWSFYFSSFLLLLYILFFFLLSVRSPFDSLLHVIFFSFFFPLTDAIRNSYTEPSSRLWYPFCFSNGTKKHFRMINIFNYRQTRSSLLFFEPPYIRVEQQHSTQHRQKFIPNNNSL